ncbi:hypothetical protein D3C85_833520 [compost metagenome]
MPGAFFQPSAVLSVMRALTRARATPRFLAVVSRLGHSSLSTKTPMVGRQWSRKAATAPGLSTGANWWITPGGRRWARIWADVSVPVVTRTVTSGRSLRMRSASGRMDRASPTLTP